MQQGFGGIATARWGALPAAMAFLVVAVSGILLRPALPVDETRYLSVAWEMWFRGDLLVPTKNFALYTHKPPLLFWLIHAIWQVTGVSEIAARMAGPLAATAAILVTGRLAARLWPDDPGAAGRAGWALAGSAVFVISGQLTMFDALLALCTLLTMLAVLTAGRTGQRRWWVAAGLALGLGGLTKGPVILVHVLPAMLAMPLWAAPAHSRGWRAGLEGTGIALATGAALVALWVVPAGLAAGAGWLDAVLWRQSAGRMAESFAHARPWWFYIALLPILLFPWAYLPKLWHQARSVGWSEPGLRLALVWIVPAFVGFSLISGKQLHYLVPELPAVALVVGRLSRAVRPSAMLPALVVGAVGLLLFAGLVGMVPMGRIGTMLQPSWAVVLVATALVGVAFGVARLGGSIGAAFATLGLVLGLNVLVGGTAIGSRYDAHRIADILTDREEEGIALYDEEYQAEFTFAGRLTRPITEVSMLPVLSEWIEDHPEGLIIGRKDRDMPPWPFHQEIDFRGRPYAIWRVADYGNGAMQ
ncbi:4-amino-4-deoxy-L-arabinose transferase-like glycosyltransferase [Palleronia aestuarii]|uniref:4-amino-4-deoxy-L-arabinose transferase-like glycosyltransferase n=1 Tax=Palleronia aestuarii TaxID=568105 RepID=A0A2W7P0K6_9RHOB|nr:glycosyltransferase family 39 protein [Palleronia aestuarii]PZX16982.1 4-amino-4-deoxy-L-arabinose transferase-like glycosyltransferase [Palleronia aestuarii]